MVSGLGIFAKRVVVDACNLMLGLLASILAKELLNDQKVAVVRYEKIYLSGGLVLQKMTFLRFLRKRMKTKPSDGHIHFRAPSKILWRTIRGERVRREWERERERGDAIESFAKWSRDGTTDVVSLVELGGGSRWGISSGDLRRLMEHC